MMSNLSILTDLQLKEYIDKALLCHTHFWKPTLYNFFKRQYQNISKLIFESL